jgi:hypothetical protein
MMGKFEQLQSDVFSIFADPVWEAEGVKAVPANFKSPDQEYIRISVIASNTGLNINSVSGILLIDIFTFAGEGPLKASLIADTLDGYLVGRSKSTASNGLTQFLYSTLSLSGVDKDNPTLYRSNYTIPFNYFGVL